MTTRTRKGDVTLDVSTKPLGWRIRLAIALILDGRAVLRGIDLND